MNGHRTTLLALLQALDALHADTERDETEFGHGYRHGLRAALDIVQGITEPIDRTTRTLYLSRSNEKSRCPTDLRREQRPGIRPPNQRTVGLKTNLIPILD